MENVEYYKDVLMRHPLFSCLSEEQYKEVETGIQTVELAEGEHLFEQGQQAERFYIIIDGRIKLYRLSPSGQEKVIEIIRPGQSFAEAVMFMERKRYPVNAQALCEVQLLSVNHKKFIEILNHSSETCFRFMADMSIRLRSRLNEIDALTLQNATLRLVNYLLVQIPEDVEDTADISLPAAKNIIASRLSIQPETLSRILSTLSKKGLVSVKGLNIHVLDVEGLRAYCEN